MNDKNFIALCFSFVFRLDNLVFTFFVYVLIKKKWKQYLNQNVVSPNSDYFINFSPIIIA